MTSQRHTLPVTRVDDDLLLDAARACVLDVGVRLTTLSSVARAAGVSRMTLYRRFPDVRSLLAALMTREFGALLKASDTLMRAVLDRDADLMLPYLVERIGGVQLIAEQFLRANLIAGHHDSSIRRADPAVQAR